MELKQHQKRAAQFVIVGFSAVVLFISSTTSFGFFYRFFDALIPPTLLGRTVGAIVSGAVGVLLFDIACAVWLYTFLHAARTPEQRAITLIMSVVTFVGSAAASVAHLTLTATGDLTVDAAARGSIAFGSLVAVIIGVVANFGASLMYTRFSYENKIAVRESDREDEIQRAEDEQAKELDKLVSQSVKERLTSIAGEIADRQAARIAGAFERRELSKYGSKDQHKQPSRAKFASEQANRPKETEKRSDNNGANFQ